MDLLNTYYVIFNVSELNKVDFSYVNEDNTSTVRVSVDGTKTFVNWFGLTPPPFINDLTTKSNIYGYAEILNILDTEEWVKKLDMNLL
jgi:hypothetical protein